MRNLMSSKTAWKVRKRRRCEVCGMKMKRTDGDIHHIMPMRVGGTNRISNLMMVCDECHKKIHEEDEYAK